MFRRALQEDQVEEVSIDNKFDCLVIILLSFC